MMNGQGSRRISSRSNMGSSQAESSNRSLSSNVERAQELLRRNDPSAYPSTLSLSMFSDNESSLHYDPKFSSASSRISDGRSATTTSDGRSTTFSPTNSNMKSIDSSSSSAQYVKMSDQSSMGKHNSSEYPPRYPSSHPKSTSGSSSSIQTSHQDATSNSHDDYSGSSDSDDNNLDDKEKYKAKNREHAKNTRLRKKSYIETLKLNLSLLSNEFEALDSDRRIKLSRYAEQMKVRTQVLQTMLQFRGQGETDINRWRTILSEHISLTLPITPYRSFPPIEVNNNQRRVAGINAFIADTASFNMMLQSLSCYPSNSNDKIMAQFQVDQSDMIMNDDQMMCKVMLQTINATECGARHEIRIPIMIRAAFSHINKLTELDLMFDVMSLMQQLRRASAKHDFQIVPNTYFIAIENSSESRMIVDCNNPYRLVFVNKKWCDVFGYSQVQAMSYTCSSLLYDVSATTSDSKPNKPSANEFLQVLSNVVKTTRPCSTIVGIKIHKAPDGSKQLIDEVLDARVMTRIYPLYAMDVTKAVTHVLLVMDVTKEMSFTIGSNNYITSLNGNRHDSNVSQIKSMTNTRLQRHKRQMQKNESMKHESANGKHKLSNSSTNSSIKTSSTSNRSGKSNISSLTSDQYSASASEKTNSRHSSVADGQSHASGKDLLLTSSNSSKRRSPTRLAPRKLGDSNPNSSIFSNSIYFTDEGLPNGNIAMQSDQFDFFDDAYDAIYDEGYDDIWSNSYGGNGLGNGDQGEGKTDGGMSGCDSSEADERVYKNLALVRGNNIPNPMIGSNPSVIDADSEET